MSGRQNVRIINMLGDSVLGIESLGLAALKTVNMGEQV